MKIMSRYSLVIILLLSAKVFAQNDMSNMIPTFQKLEDQWNKAILSGDTKGLSELYTEDAYSLPDKTPMWKGRNAIMEGHEKEKQMIKFTESTSQTLDVYSAGDYEIEIGSWAVTFTTAGSDQPMKEVSKYVNVWQKQSDGTWKIKTDCWNADSPGSNSQAGAKETEKK
jgi:uncharacterized protein (TIGR02246 family)